MTDTRFEANKSAGEADLWPRFLPHRENYVHFKAAAESPDGSWKTMLRMSEEAHTAHTGICMALRHMGDRFETTHFQVPETASRKDM